MPWGRLDDGLYDHPKLDDLGRDRLAGVGLWTLAISWCNRRLTDGFVPSDRIRLLGGTPALADRLVASGLFERHPEGYVVHDFLTFNESREQVEARRDADRKRKRRPNGHDPDDQSGSARMPRGKRPDSGGSPAGVHPETDGSPDGNQPDSDSRDARAGGTRRASGRASRPGPTESDSRPRINETDQSPTGASAGDGPVDPSDRADDQPWVA